MLAENEKKVRRVAKPVPGEYIVLLEKNVDPQSVAAELGRRHGVKIQFVWEHALKGFSFIVNPQNGAKVASELAADARVKVVEENAITELDLSAQQNLPSGDAGFWGLDRLDNIKLPWSSSRESGTYVYTNSGLNVPIYIVDTGVRGDHTEFGSRVSTGYNAMTEFQPNHDFYDPWPANNPCGVMPGTQPVTVPVDGPAGTRTFNPGYSTFHEFNNGHGTAVASIAAGSTYGAAKQASIIPVKVFDCDQNGGTATSLLNGLNWIAGNHNGSAGVVNMSVFYLGGAPAGSGLTCDAANDEGQGGAIDAAVDTLVYFKNLVVTASANNGNVDARCTVPARTGAAITVGGAMRNNTRLNIDAVVSNFGPAIDFFAPAETIASAHLSSIWARRTNGTSGTSFASPLAAGCAARYRQTYPSINAENATTDIIYATIPNIMTGDIGAGSLNRYLHCPTNW